MGCNGARVFMSMAKSDIWYSSEYKMYFKRVIMRCYDYRRLKYVLI